MPKFGYTATASDGSVATGTYRAKTMAEARLELLEQRLRVTELGQAAAGKLNIELVPQRIRRADLMHLSRQLGAFIRAGIPILDSLRTLTDETERAPPSRTRSTATPRTSRRSTGASSAARNSPASSTLSSINCRPTWSAISRRAGKLRARSPTPRSSP
jgi:type II secretory pathway component PulF